MMNKTTIIAEIGLNHGGDLDTALRLIDIAKSCKADVVKFQKRTPELSLPRHLWEQPKQTPWGTTESYIDYRRKIEFGRDEYREIDLHCKRIGIQWTVSVWDNPSVKFMKYYDVPFLKIPSAHLTNNGLLYKTMITGKPIVLSTGMSTLEEVDAAVDFIGKYDLTLLHCHSAYPQPENESNLRVIQTLRERYALPIGYSSHAVSPFVAIAAMWRYDACMIEAHLTYDRSAPGSDMAASLEPDGLSLLVRERDRLERIDGDGVKRVYPSEESKRRSLRGS